MTFTARFAQVTAFGLLLGLAPSYAHGQVKSPSPPDEYQVLIRYRIRAPQNVRLAQFLPMVRYLESIGFHKNPGPENEAEDPEQTRMSGTIALANARKILADPHVKMIVLAPASYSWPPDKNTLVKVQMELTPGLPPARSLVLAEETAALLGSIGFVEAVGYDNRHHTRLVGRMPAGKIASLLDDLRGKEQVQAPLSGVSPFLVAEVLAEPAGVSPIKALPPPPAVPADRSYLNKVSPEARALLGSDWEVRLELDLNAASREDREWRRDLQIAAPGSVIEGLIGKLATIKARTSQLENLARLRNVLTVRLPRVAESAVLSGVPRSEILKVTGLDRLQRMGLRSGTRIALIDVDFAGYREAKANGAKIRYVDLAEELDANLASPAETGGTSHGMLCAAAVASALPDAELTLIRVDPTAPYQLEEIARLIQGEPVHTDSLYQRVAELTADRDRLNTASEALLKERNLVLENFGQDQAAVKAREAFFQKQANLDKQEKALKDREQRYLKLVRELRELKGIQIVARLIVWNDGYPLDHATGVARYFDDPAFHAAYWFHAAGTIRGQVWHDLFRDVDGNGVMEFAAPSTPIQPGMWTRELNFLAWQPYAGSQSLDLPKGKIHLSIQWREPHDRSLWSEATDPYRLPLADVRLQLLRQRDPSGTRLPTDDLEVVAQSTGWPEQLESRPGWGTYEETLEFTIPAPGRYALRIEGRIPNNIRPKSAPTLPSLEKSWEMDPRIYVEYADQANRERGRLVFRNYSESGQTGPAAGTLHPAN
jgi:hypothetical protein